MYINSYVSMLFIKLIKGIMLQARRAQCDHTHQATPMGQFLEPKETALKAINCSGKAVGLLTKN
jgi:hypothetical protein